MLSTPDWYNDKRNTLLAEKEEVLTAMSGLSLTDEKRILLLRLRNIDMRLAGVEYCVKLWEE